MVPPRDPTALPADPARERRPVGGAPQQAHEQQPTYDPAERAEDATGTERRAGEVPARPAGATPRLANWASLEQAVDSLRARPVDELDDGHLANELKVLERVIRQLKARQTRLATARTERARQRAATAAEQSGRPGDAAGERAARRSERQMAHELGWTPGQSKRNVDLGRQLRGHGSAGRALDDGELTERHASLLASTLRGIVEPDLRDRLEARLIRAARVQDPVTFGRTCREVTAEHDAAAADRADTMRHKRRAGSMRQTDDGMIEVSARVAGVDGELLMTAWHAFRRPDAKGETRTREQAGADALVAMAKAALDAGTAPSRHGVRPHVTVHLDWRAIARDHGVGHGTLTGPLPITQIRRLLSDCDVAPLLLDRPRIALEAGEAVRTFPIGLQRTLEARDRTCIAVGCDVPAIWCQAIHLDGPYRFGGRLSPTNAALACTFHHVAYDRHGWVITWHRGRPILHHPNEPPDLARFLDEEADSSTEDPEHVAARAVQDEQSPTGLRSGSRPAEVDPLGLHHDPGVSERRRERGAEHRPERWSSSAELNVPGGGRRTRAAADAAGSDAAKTDAARTDAARTDAARASDGGSVSRPDRSPTLWADP